MPHPNHDSGGRTGSGVFDAAAAYLSVASPRDSASLICWRPATNSRIPRSIRARPPGFAAHPRNRPEDALSVPHEIDRDRAGLALQIANRDLFAVARAELVEQRQRVVVVDEAHGFSWVQ